MAALLRGGLAALVTVLIIGMVGIATLIVLNSSSPSPRGRAATPTRPPQRSASTLIAAPSFQLGVQGWQAKPGTLFSRGQLGRPDASYARIQRDPTNPPATDPSTDAPMVGIGTRLLASAPPGTQLKATLRVRATKPGIKVVVRLSEWEGSRRVEDSEGRLTLPDTSWRQVGSDHRVLRSGTTIDLEVWALALGMDEALFVDPPVVSSA